MNDRQATLAADAELAPAELAADQILEGSPQVFERVLWTSPDGGVTAGLWEITPGVVTDVEADELFTVLTGRATVEVRGGPTLELAPGVTGVLRAGDETVWRVHETLRKMFVVATGD